MPLSLGLVSFSLDMLSSVGAAEIAVERGPVVDLHRPRRFKMNARRQMGRKVCPPHRKGRGK